MFDNSTRILSKNKNDPVFWSVADMTRFWGRFIDDVFSMFSGHYEQAEWYFNKLNSLFPGEVHFKWEFSREGGIFLNVELFINRETKKFETKYYVKPSNKRLFLHFRSNHPEHTFRSIVYSQALQGIMINSREEWNIEYLRELREKFLQQDYPLNLINEEYTKALQISRMDLLFNDSRKKKRKVISPLIITFNPGNPPIKRWIQEEIKVLHEDPTLKRIFPKIDVVTRQAENIGQSVIKSRHFKLHNKNCVTCLRIDDEKTKFTSSRTGRTYKITRHYTCESSHVIYLARCCLCNVDYVGQTTRTMRKRHLGHRADIRA